MKCSVQDEASRLWKFAELKHAAADRVYVNNNHNDGKRQQNNTNRQSVVLNDAR